MRKILLPSKIATPRQLRGLLALLADVKTDDIVDFREFKFYVPVAVVAVLAILKKTGARILPQIERQHKYLQRIDFFRIARPNVALKESFTRKEEKTFTRIQTISATTSELNIAKNICFDILKNVEMKKGRSSSEKLDNIKATITYALGEIVRNVIQHSESQGFVFSQYFPKRDIIRIGIADCGIGIRESFRRNNSEFFDPERDDDVSMLQKALQDRTSSKFNVPGSYGLPDNQGVGLTRVDSICELLYGSFFIASGGVCYSRSGKNAGYEVLPSTAFPGTVVGIEISSFQLDNYPFPELISEAEGLGGQLEDTCLDALFL